MCNSLHVTRHTSHVTRHTSHVTRYTSHVTRHPVLQKVREARVFSASGGGGGGTIKPDIIFCTKNASYKVKEEFEKANVAVVSNVKRSCMIRLLRCSNAPLIKQRDNQIFESSCGYLEDFDVKSYERK